MNRDQGELGFGLEQGKKSDKGAPQLKCVEVDS